jgi:FtsH-binding integral membrane protein
MSSAARHSKWREGARAGLGAAAAGSLWSAIVDVAWGRPFETWSFLGSVVLQFLGLLRWGGKEHPAIAAVVFFVFITAIFMLLGRAAVGVAHRSDVHPSLTLAATFVMTLVIFALTVIAAAFTNSRLSSEAWLQMLGSPVVAFSVLGLRVYRTHPSLALDLKRASDE